MKEILIGIILLAFGAYLSYYWLEELLLVIKGSLGLFLLLLGGIILWIGIEDKKIEEEIKKIEEEIKKEDENNKK